MDALRIKEGSCHLVTSVSRLAHGGPRQRSVYMGANIISRMQLHIRKDGSEFGPHTEREIQEFFDHGVISNTDIVVLADGSEVSVVEFLKTTATKKLTLPLLQTAQAMPKVPGSEVKRFSISKGILIRREHHGVGALKCDQGGAW